jgi:flagellar biosynthetic protein FlhB
LLKLVVALAALVWIGVKMTAPTLDSIGRAPGLLPSATLALALDVVAPLVLIAALAGGGDFALSRFKWLADLRMTKHEVKEELRQAEGDPHVRQRVRSIRMQRARRRMIAAVPRATMVVANPTHYAIALRYVRGETAAPLVVAKGVDAMALTIRKIAEEAGVPVIEDKALARSMYDQVSVDQMIPAAFYAAVAELVHALSKAAAERARPRVAISAGAPIQ